MKSAGAGMEGGEQKWKRHYWMNTLSNYIRTLTRLLLGLVLFRLLYSGLSAEEFGYWSLLWSLFGYGVLLDFGFGYTAQKAVAEATETGDWAGLNRLLSTLFITFIALAAVLFIVFMAIRGPFMAGFGVSAANRPEFDWVYLIFFSGLALTFPFGLFPEVLKGLHRLDLANWVRTGALVLNFVGIVWALWAGLGFAVVVLISVVTTLLPNLVAMVVAYRQLPGLRLSPALFELGAVRSQIGFSVAAYLITFSNLLMSKSDQLVIGMTLGVGAIAAYQAAFKVGEMFNLFTVQLQEALGPAAASLHARGDRAGLRTLLLRMSRLTFLVSTPLYGLSALYIEPLIRLLTGMERVDAEIWWVGQILLLAIYSSQLTNSCSKRILMMTGKQGRLLVIALLDGFGNLAVSVVLVLSLGLAGVALGTLIPTVVVGWLLVVPLALRHVEIAAWEYLKQHLRGSWPLLIFVVSSALVWKSWPIAVDSDGLRLLWELGLRGAVCAGPCGLLLVWQFKKERQG